VIGIKTHVHELGGLLEFMAIGTAVKPVRDFEDRLADASASGHHYGQGHLDQPRAGTVSDSQKRQAERLRLLAERAEVDRSA